MGVPSAVAKHGRAPLWVALAAIALLFVWTVDIRAPYLDLPISRMRHGEGTPRVLRHMQVWDEVGLGATNFMMRTTGTAPADRFIPSLGNLTAGDGIYYYASYPPLFPLAPYLAFKALGVSPGVQAVRLFNLGLHAVAALLLFLLGRRVLASRGEAHASSAGAFAAGVYLLMPAAMWYHSNAYTTGSLATPLLIACTYLAVRVACDERLARWLPPTLVVSTFALAYTDWVAATFVAVALAFAVFARRDKRLWLVAALAAGGAASAVLLMTVQYSSVAGLQAFLAGLSGKFEMRSGLSGASHYSIGSLDDWKRMWVAFRKDFVPGLKVLAVFAGLYVAGGPRYLKKLERVSATFPRPMLLALGLTLGAGVLHTIVLFSHTVIHDFGLLKYAIPLALLIGALAAEIAAWGALRASRIGMLAVLGLVLVFTVKGGLPQALRRDFSISYVAYSIGTSIAEADVAEDEVVFLLDDGFYLGSTAVYYAGRNITHYTDAESAASQMRLSSARGGVLFVMDDTGRKIGKIERLGPDGERPSD